jgi:hypothetical protein
VITPKIQGSGTGKAFHTPSMQFQGQEIVPSVRKKQNREKKRGKSPSFSNPHRGRKSEIGHDKEMDSVKEK